MKFILILNEMLKMWKNEVTKIYNVPVVIGVPVGPNGFEEYRQISRLE